MNKRLFKKELEQVEYRIKTVKDLDKVNERLQENNWVFIHPYSQTGDIGVLNRLLSSSENPNEEIVIFFARKFFDLRGNNSFY